MSVLFVDSTQRDATLYPHGNSYVVHLVDPIRNVTSVDLVMATFPNLTTTPVALLDIAELRSVADAFVTPINYFAILPTNSASNTKTFTEMSDFKVRITFPKPIDTLYTMTIRWTDAQGVLLQGMDAHSFLLRLHTEIPAVQAPVAFAGPPPPVVKSEARVPLALPWLRPDIVLIVVVILIAIIFLARG